MGLDIGWTLAFGLVVLPCFLWTEVGLDGMGGILHANLVEIKIKISDTI
jgi:hypothetical protein